MNELDTLMYSETDILERVDEYTLYCQYLGYNPLIGGKYSSPLRPGDTDPSFGIYIRKHGVANTEFMWKDAGLGLHGNIFDLVARMFNINTLQARWKVSNDNNLGAMPVGCTKVQLFEPEYISDIWIRIVSRPFTKADLQYWKKYNVTVDILRRYNATSLSMYWLRAEQTVPTYPKGLGFAYRIWDKYQLYFPHAEKKNKFRNNWTELCVPGFLQLTYTSPLCIVTKAYKDVMCLASLGYEAIAPKSESTMLPEECIKHLQRKFTKVVTLFDNDGKHKAAEYPFPELHVPLESGTKDISDYCDKYGPDKTRELLTQLL